MIIIANKKDTDKLTCWNWVPGVKKDQNPYRSKLAGISGILVRISIIICYFKITQGAIEITLDGESTLSTASSDDGLDFKQIFFDILQDIHNRI